MNVKDRYLELLALTQSYLLQNYELKQQIIAEPETYSYFKQAFIAAAAKPLSPQPVPPPTPSSALKEPIPLKTTAPPPKKPAADPEVKSITNVVKEEVAKDPFTLTPPPKAETADLRDFHKLISSIAPHLKLVEVVPEPSHAPSSTIPADARAILLSPLPKSSEERLFVEAVAKAIQLQFGPCGILYTSLGDTPLPKSAVTIDLTDLRRYIQEPAQKAMLWNQICNTL